MMRYLNGSVGPRPAFSPLNIPGGIWNGLPLTVLWVGGVRKVVVVMANGDVLTSPDCTGTPTWTLIANIGFVPSCATVNGNGVTIGSSVATGGSNPSTASSCYVDVVANTVTPITGMPQCNLMVAYNQFIVVGLRSSASIAQGKSFVWFSDLPTNLIDTPGINWTAATGNGVGVVGVGTAEPVSGLFTQKDTLVISKQGGEWWTLTGLPTGPPTIRRADVGLDFKGVGGAVRQSSIWYPNGRDIGVFNGSATQIMELPDVDDFGGSSRYAYNTFTGVSSLVQADEFMLTGWATNLGGLQVPWVFIHHGLSGAATAAGWSRHVLDYRSLSGNVVSPCPLPLYVGDGITWLFMQGAASQPVDVFQFDVRQEVPFEKLGAFPKGNPQALYSDCQSTEVTGGFFSIPEWWAPDGHNAHVTRIFVDLDYDAAAWQNASDSGINPANVVRMDVNVNALNLRQQDGQRGSQPQVWGPKDIPRTIPGSNTNMTRTRAVFNVGEQGPASGFQININNVRGIQIYRVLANVDVSVSEPF